MVLPSHSVNEYRRDGFVKGKVRLTDAGGEQVLSTKLIFKELIIPPVQYGAGTTGPGGTITLTGLQDVK